MAANLINKYADSTILQWILCNEHNESIQQQKENTEEQSHIHNQANAWYFTIKVWLNILRKDKIQR